MNACTAPRNSASARPAPRHRSVQAVRDRDVPSVELPFELDVVVAGHAQRRPGLHHRHHDLERVHDPRPAIDEVADEPGLPPLRMLPRRGPSPPTIRAAATASELVAAPVHVPDDVERPTSDFRSFPERLTLDLRPVHVPPGLQDVTCRNPLAPKGRAASGQLALLVADDVRPEAAVAARPVALMAHRVGQIEHDRDRQDVVLRAAPPAACAPPAGRSWRRSPSAARARRRAATWCSAPNASSVATGRSRRRTRGRGRRPTTAPRSA